MYYKLFDMNEQGGVLGRRVAVLKIILKKDLSEDIIFFLKSEWWEKSQPHEKLRKVHSRQRDQKAQRWWSEKKLFFFEEQKGGQCS